MDELEKYRLQRRFKESHSITVHRMISKFDPHKPIENNPQKCLGLTSYYLNLGHELHSVGAMELEDRRTKLKEMLHLDFLLEIKELEEVGMGYMNT